MADEIKIRERAYQIWIDTGRPNGQSDEHWRLAELALSMEAVNSTLGDDEVKPPKTARKSAKAPASKSKKSSG